MKRATAKKPAPVAEDFVVRAARGFERNDGGLVWQGMLYKGDSQVADFLHDGGGGCLNWNIRSHELFAEFERLAKEKLPALKFEHADNYVGELWDAAIMRGPRGN